MFVCPAGHLAIRKARGGKKNIGENQVDTYFFDVEKCKTCPLRVNCYKPGAKTKTYSVGIKSDAHLQQVAFRKRTIIRKKQNNGIRSKQKITS
ncbi:MAG: family transposase [Mucilaginibacter sp.]|nr:family transposase [Mucilaginibacter sp.]